MDEVTRLRSARGWPGLPMPVPLVPLCSFEREGEELKFEWPPRWAELGGEVAIRELPYLDCADVDQVVSFIERHGMIFQLPTRSELPFYRDSEAQTEPGRRHLFDISVHLAMAKALATHALAARRGVPTAPAWDAFFHAERLHEKDAQMYFVQYLNQGLRRFVPHISLDVEYTDIELRYEYGTPELDLYDALCIQIHNMWVTDEGIRECGHCGSAFIRHQGRSTKGQHRLSGGVEYCSHRCAKNASAKRTRDRKRAEDKRGEATR